MADTKQIESTPQIVAWFNPDNENNVINAAQYPHVLEKNKGGYLPCIVAPEYVHILTWTRKDSLTDCFREFRSVYATYEGAKKMADLVGESAGNLNVSIVGSKLYA